MESLFLSAKITGKIKKDIDNLAEALNVRLKLDGNTLSIDGNALDEYNALNVIKAISAGFDFKTALLLQNEECMIEEIKIKYYVKPSRLKQVKARIIGTEGRALKTISLLSECFLKLSDNSVFIIGNAEDVKIARNALISLIKGSKHSNLYAKLEHKPQFGEDLGLREEKRKG